MASWMMTLMLIVCTFLQLNYKIYEKKNMNSLKISTIHFEKFDNRTQCPLDAAKAIQVDISFCFVESTELMNKLVVYNQSAIEKVFPNPRGNKRRKMDLREKIVNVAFVAAQGEFAIFLIDQLKMLFL